MNILVSLCILIGGSTVAQVDNCCSPGCLNCDPECVNGWCFDGSCICDFPWEGVACEIERQPEPCDLPCENGSEPDFFCNRCLCVVGSNCGGTFCNICSPIPVCDSPCLNGGFCVATNTCSCQPGWMGPTCEVLIDGCNPACAHGNCVDFFGSFRCQCDQGWMGSTCEECSFGFEGPNCDPIPCDPECVNGTCLGGGCQCDDPGWVGDACDEPRCCDPNCVNGQCRGLNVCDCDSGWLGPLCDMQQHLRVDAMLEVCGEGDQQDEQGARGGGNELLSLLSQAVTPLSVSGAGVSAVWNAQRAQSSVAAERRMQVATTFAGSNITDNLTVTTVPARGCLDCRLKFDFALVRNPMVDVPIVSAPGWTDQVARAETIFEFNFDSFGFSRGIKVRHEWRNCMKFEPCVPGSACEVCEEGMFKFRDGELSQNGGLNLQLCRSEFEPNGQWLCNVNDTPTPGADASPDSTFSIQAIIPFDIPFEVFYSIQSASNLFCRRAALSNCDIAGPGCRFLTCASNSPNRNEACSDSSDCNGGTCTPPLQVCDAQSSNAGDPCEFNNDCNGGVNGFCIGEFLPQAPSASVRSDVTLQLLKVSVVEPVIIKKNLVWIEVPVTIESDSGFNYLNPGSPIVSPGLLLNSPDLDGDGDTDLDDFSALLGFFGGPGDTTPPKGVDPSELFLADQDGDNDVDLHDLAILFAAINQ